MDPTAMAPTAIRRREGKRRRGNYLMLKILIAWVIFVVLLALLIRIIGREDNNIGAQVRSPLEEVNRMSDEDRHLLEEALPKCGVSLGGFLSSTAPESMNQFIWNPIRHAGKLAKYYQFNPIQQLDPQQLSVVSQKVLNLEKGPAIAVLFTSTDRLKLDSIFYQEDGEWRLDWEQFARVSDEPWPIFLMNDSEGSAEFRLLGRMRRSDHSLNQHQLSLSLYHPKFGKPGEPEHSSPEILVPLESPEGRLLAAAFLAASQKKSPYDGSLETGDPDGMVRLRVRVSKKIGPNGREFQIDKVLACHWLDLDEPGLAPLNDQELKEFIEFRNRPK